MMSDQLAPPRARIGRRWGLSISFPDIGGLSSPGDELQRGAIMSNRFTRMNIALMSLDEARFNRECSELLSPREREIALLVARGLTNKEVCCELRLSDGTVKQHIHKIFLKLARAPALS
jgi:FixJ family two-component response regulator